MDKFQEMRVFTAVVEAGSFVRAADHLDMSKAAVSLQLAALESRLGVRLLHRTTRRLSLTEDGEVFYARSKELLANLDEAEAEISTRSGQAVGLVRVSVPVSFGLLKLAPLWADFMAQHPRVSLDVTLSDRTVDLVEEGFDVAVRIARLPNSSLISRRLSSTRLLLCASPQYLARHGTPTTPDDLLQHSVIGYSLSALGDRWEFESEAGQQHSVKITPRMSSNSGDTCCQVAIHHQGIVLQPQFLVQPYLDSGALVSLLPQYCSSQLGIYAVYPSRKHVSPKVRLLVDYLVKQLADA